MTAVPEGEGGGTSESEEDVAAASAASEDALLSLLMILSLFAGGVFLAVSTISVASKGVEAERGAGGEEGPK